MEFTDIAEPVEKIYEWIISGGKNHNFPNYADNAFYCKLFKTNNKISKRNETETFNNFVCFFFWENDYILH
jgi:hypothetical protein